MFWQWNKVRLAFLFPVLLGLTGLLIGCTGKNEIEIRDLSAGGETSATGGSSSDREDSSILGKGEGFVPGYGRRTEGRALVPLLRKRRAEVRSRRSPERVHPLRRRLESKFLSAERFLRKGFMSWKALPE
mgnify:CR=1 FL=1